MASTLKHLRSSTADKRPTASGLVDGQLAINTASGTPALFFKDSNGGVVKVGPAHVGSAAPNAVPAGSAGNSLGELWVDNSLTTPGLNYYTGSAFVNLTPSGTTTAVGLVELATPAETQTGTDGVRAVTPSGLQSKVSDSTSTTSSTTIASSTAVKSAYDLANAALPKAGGTVTGELLIGTTGSLVFEGSSDDSFETTIAVTNPTADHTITFPNVTGAVVTTGDSGTVTSTMIANDTIVNADINSAAAIVDTKLATISTADKVSVSALNIDGATDIGGALENGDLFIVDDGAGGTNRKAPAFRMAQLTYSGVTGDITIASGGTSAIGAGVIVDADVNASAAIAHSKLANITAGSVLLGNATNVPTATALTGDVTVNSSGVTAISSGVIVNADVNASAAIAGTKISPDFGSQTITTTGVVSAALGAAATPSITFTGDLNTGIYSPGADQVAISTNGTGRLFVDASGNVGVGGSPYAPNGSTEKSLAISSSGLVASVYVTALQGGTTRGALLADEFADNVVIGSISNHPCLLVTNNTERLRVTSDGKLGLGTSSPSANLDIVVGSGTATQKLGSSSVSGGSYLNLHGASASKTWFIGANYNFAGVLEFTQSTANGGTTPSSTPAMVLSAAGNVGIGTATPGNLFVVSNGGAAGLEVDPVGINSAPRLVGYNRATSQFIQLTLDGLTNVFATSGTERARIDSSGRLLVGTSTSISTTSGFTPAIQVAANSGPAAAASSGRYTADEFASGFIFQKSRNATVGSHTIVSNGDELGRIEFEGSDGSAFRRGAEIKAFVDGTPGANDMPGRLVFSTTADGASSPTERVRITQAGYFKASNAASYYGSTGSYHEFNNSLNSTALIANNTNASFSIQGANGAVFSSVATRAANSAYSLLCTFSDAANDVEHNLRGDGQAYADQSWNGGGADYAEYFEWSDDNLDAEDRRGISVVLDGEKIRPAVDGENPIGVISGNPSVVGDAAWNKWSGKYLRDDYGTYILDENGDRKLNPAYDPDQEYVSREQRPEWDCVGLMGKLRIRKGQPTGSRWIKMRDISDSVEEWLVR